MRDPRARADLRALWLPRDRPRRRSGRTHLLLRALRGAIGGHGTPGPRLMATAKQVKAAKQNVQKAQGAATKKRTIANLPKSTRDALVEQAQRGRRRGGQAGH